MQTFLPYHNFVESARVLDNKRLGKQRVEALTILRILTGRTKTNGWKNHPAVQMWEGYELDLASYGYRVCQEWNNRGFKDTCMDKIALIAINITPKTEEEPPWLGNERFHNSHRSNLLRKDPEHYSQFGWSVQPDLPYWWPTKEGY